MNSCNATTLSHLDTGWKYIKQNYAFIMNNNDKSNPNVTENDQNWIWKYLKNKIMENRDSK